MCLMVNLSVEDIVKTCDASVTDTNAIICPSIPSGNPTYVLQSDKIRYLNANFDDKGLRYITTSTDNTNCVAPAMCSDYGFSGLTIYRDATNEIVELIMYSNYLGATSDIRYKNSPFQAKVPASVVAVRETYFCPSGSTIWGFYESADSHNPIHYQAMVLLCVPLFCSAGQYPSADGLNCLNCPSGKYTVGCTPGNLANFMSTCAQCTNGGSTVVYISSGTSQYSCGAVCAAGYGESNSNGGGKGVCGPCLKGYFGASSGAGCSPCPSGSYTDTQGGGSCTACPANQYQPNSGKTSCLQCTTPYSIPGKYWISCNRTSPATATPCTACSAGNYLSPACGLIDYAVPQCTPCPIGTYQKSPIPVGYAGSTVYTCDQCLPGYYQDQTGQAACKACTNKAIPPANGQYAANLSTNGNACPFQCNTGFGWNLVSCAACPLGKYAPGGLPLADCKACSKTLDRNAYWLRPVVFNSGYDGCPWDCNAGFYSVVSSGGCAPCVYPNYSSAANLRVYDTATANRCVPCDACANGATYESGACTTTQNRACSQCTSSCQAGYYMTPCNVTQNTRCVSCDVCPSGKYILSQCSGQVFYIVLSCIFYF